MVLPDGKRIDYVCDPLGRRIAKKVNGIVVEKYLWQGLTRLLAVYDGNNSLLMRFEYVDERMPVAMKMGGATYYLSYDQVGSLRLVADASGNVVKRISYDSFGNILEDTNPFFMILFGFAGGLHDRDTGLVRFGYRDYDPETGRWTAKDPIGFAGGDTDLYGYVLNDPANFVDPTGEWIGQAITFGVGIYTLYKVIDYALEANKEFSEAAKQQQKYFDKLAEGLNEGNLNADELTEIQKACSESMKKGYDKGLESAKTATKLKGTWSSGPLVTPTR